MCSRSELIRVASRAAHKQLSARELSSVSRQQMTKARGRRGGSCENFTDGRGYSNKRSGRIAER